MSPDVTFNLSEENFKAYETLLAQQGIKVRPGSREIVENLEDGRTSVVRIAGVLTHGDCEFVYEIHPGGAFILFVVDAFVHNRSAGNALVAAVERAFPQPEREIPSQTRSKRTIDKHELVNVLGCLAILGFIIAVCVLAVIGLRSILLK